MSELGTPERPQPAAPTPLSTPNHGVGLIEKRTWASCPEALWDPTARPALSVNKLGEVYQPRLHLLTLATVAAMLSTRFTCDMHFVSYIVIDPQGRHLTRFPRLRKEHLGLIRQRGFDVRHCIRFADIDTLKDHAAITPEEVESIRSALKGYPGILYFTRGGARLIQLLPKVLTPEQYEVSLHWWLLELRALLPGFKVDGSCKEWVRLMRCPRVIRGGVSYHDTEIEGTFEYVDPGDITPLPPVHAKVRAFDVLTSDTATGLDRAKRYALRLVDAKAGEGYVSLRKYATVLGRDAASGIITPETAIAVLENAILDWDVEHAVYERAIEDCFEYGLSCGPWPDAEPAVDQSARVSRLLNILGKGGSDDR